MHNHFHRYKCTEILWLEIHICNSECLKYIHARACAHTQYISTLLYASDRLFCLAHSIPVCMLHCVVNACAHLSNLFIYNTQLVATFLILPIVPYNSEGSFGPVDSICQLFRSGRLPHPPLQPPSYPRPHS